MSHNALRKSTDRALPTGIADSFIHSARRLAPAGVPISDLRNIPADPEWLRTHLAHRLERWIYMVEPITFKWDSFDQLYLAIDREYAKRMDAWQYPTEGMKHWREDEANAPVPHPKRWLGFRKSWADRCRKGDHASCYQEALTLCILEQAYWASFYLTRRSADTAMGAPSIGYAMADTFAYAVQTVDDAFHAGELWLDEIHRIERLADLNRSAA